MKVPQNRRIEMKLLFTLEYLLSALAGMAARVESLCGWMGESTLQVEGLFESLLAQSFEGGR